MSFSVRTHGKWILAGEHAVLRGCPALVFPIESSFLEMKYQDSTSPLHVDFTGDRGAELKLLVWGVLEQAAERLGHSLSELKGRMELISNLPVGGGLGASAALCVAVGRWCEFKGWIKDSELYDFCRGLEDLFHGESSGVDIAVALSNRGLRFVRGGERLKLNPKWRPHIFLSYSGHRGVTSECVAKVKALAEREPATAERLDKQMASAVDQAEQALNKSEAEGLSLLTAAVNLAGDCFERWGLTEGEIGQHIHDLKRAGALAVKPTGSGGGGYVLSLWDGTPPVAMQSRLLRV